MKCTNIMQKQPLKIYTKQNNWKKQKQLLAITNIHLILNTFSQQNDKKMSTTE